MNMEKFIRLLIALLEATAILLACIVAGLFIYFAVYFLLVKIPVVTLIVACVLTIGYLTFMFLHDGGF